MLDSADVRRINKNKIRQIMWCGGEFDKKGIARETGLSVATCNTLLNELEEAGEIIGNKKRVQSVGRSTVFYQINEVFESILCVTFEKILDVKTLDITVISTLGKVIFQSHKDYERLDYQVIEDNICSCINQYKNISQIMIGTPSIAEHGQIHHCDIDELEGEDIVRKLESQTKRPVYLENDMHFKVYGYYKKCGQSSDVITLANFPAHILPGTASIYKGTVIKGHNQFAGMVGFLPFGMKREEELQLLVKPTVLPFISQSICSIISIMNPSIVVFTGDLIDLETIDEVRKECLKYIPSGYMPSFIYEENLNIYYLEGMYQKSLELKGNLYNDRT